MRTRSSASRTTHRPGAAGGRPVLPSLTTADVAKKVALVRDAAGERWERLELNVIVFDASVSSDRHSLLANVATRLKATAAAIVDSPFFLFGSLDEVRERLLRRREDLAISYVAIPQP